MKPTQEAESEGATYGLTYEDYERFEKIKAVVSIAPIKILPQEVRHLDRRHNGRVVGTLADYSVVNDIYVAKGRFLTDEDNAYERNVVVIGAKIADRLFPFGDALGQAIRVGRSISTYEVVGELGERGSGPEAEDLDSDVYIPLKTCMARFGERTVIGQPGRFRKAEPVEIHQIALIVARSDQVQSTANELQSLLAQFHKRTDWEVKVQP
jgi:putative ABC transport system permease protein